MKNILKTIAFTAILALIFTACIGHDAPKDSLSVSTNKLTFEANDTTTQLVTVATTAKSWAASANNNWITVKQVDNVFNVTVDAYTVPDSARNGTITVNAGSADPVTVAVTQNKFIAPAFTDIVKSYYTATGTPGFLTNPGPSSWTGQVIPSTGSDQFYEITGWGGKSGSVYCDFKDHQIFMDNYTVLGNDGTVYDAYFQALAINQSTHTFYIITGDYKVAYDKTNKIMDFSGTYNGLPIYVGVVAKNRNTGNIEGGFTDLYASAKLKLTPVSQSSGSAPATKAGAISYSKSISAESFKNYRMAKTTEVIQPVSKPSSEGKKALLKAFIK